MKIIRTSTISLSLNILLKGQLKFLNNFFNVIGISSEGDDLAQVKNREGITTIAVEMERGISPLKDLISLIRLYKEFKREKPIIVHSITPKAGLLSMLAGKLAGVPIRMHTFTGLIFPSKSGKLQKLLIKMDQLLCWAATNIYPEGKGVKDDLTQYNITSKPLKVLANGNVNGIDLEYFSLNAIDKEEVSALRNELNIQSNDFIFIFIGRLVGDKGINELIAAFKQISDEHPQKNIKLLLVGPLEEDLDPLQNESVKEIQCNPKIISVGFQKDVRQYIAISDVLVFPSYREGFPNVVMQAGAMGLPSIVSNINGSNEIIVEGINGTIIPVKDKDAIYKAMLDFFNNNVYLSTLKENSRRMIEERYEQSLVWNALFNEYKNLLKEKGYDI